MKTIGNVEKDAQVRAVASGALSTGDTVVVNSNGTVSVVAGSSNTLGAEASIDASSGDTNIALAYDTANAKIVAIYRDKGNSDYGTAVVGTISGTSISFGTAVVFESSSSRQPVVTYDSNAGKIVVSYYTSAGPNQGKSIVGTVSGTSISFGTPVDFGPFTDSVNYLTTCFDSNSNKVFVGFRQSGSGNRYSCVVGDVSGTSISFGSVTVIDSNIVSYCRSTFDSVNNKVIVSWRDHNNSFYGETAVGTISGTSISFGTTVVAASYNAHYGDVGFDSTSGKVVYAVGNAGNNQGNAYVGTVSGTGISWSSATLFNEGTPIYIEVNEDIASGKIVISFSETSVSYEGVLRSGTITGTTLSLDSAVVFSSTALGFSEHSAAYDSGNGQLVFGYTLTAGTAQARTYSAFSTNLTSENFVGFANSGYADGQSAALNSTCSVDKNQSGLTAGETYYVQTDGTLGTTPADPSVLAGTAISSNSIIVKG